MRNSDTILVGKLKGKRLFVRSRSRWKDNIRMDLREVVWKCVDWVNLVQDRDHWWDLMNTVMNFRFP